MATQPKAGPLSEADFLAIWESTNDESYWRPLEEAGEGEGLEQWTQLFAQLARVSQAVDVSTQAMFALPWSGQTAPPAAGAAKARVTLTFTRDASATHRPLVFGAGTVFYEEVAQDWSDDGPVDVQTGRRYTLLADLALLPGEVGPDTSLAEAEAPGWGYNNPFPGTIRLIEQPGEDLSRDGASVRVEGFPSTAATTTGRVFLDAANEADVVIPDHVGQYVFLTAGANVGMVARAIAYRQPEPSATPPRGGTLELELVNAVQAFPGNFAGTFVVGETVSLLNGATARGSGRVLKVGALADGSLVVLYRLLSLDTLGWTNASPVDNLLGQSSGATLTAGTFLWTTSSVPPSPQVFPETGTATWEMLLWGDELGVAVTNAASPTGGRLGVLDELGREKNLPRAPGESDDVYRQRVTQIADVVVPNAIRRMLNRVSGIEPWCFREAGQASYPGWFFDANDAWDNDFVSVAAAIVGTFIDGEPVVQDNGGYVATGRAAVNYLPPSVVPSPPPNTYSFLGVTRPRGVFTETADIVGQWSGARAFAPAVVAGGLRTQDRYRVIFGYLEMRAYFYVEVPDLDTGDTGFAYDTHPHGAYDAAPYNDFYDGIPVQASLFYRNIFQAIDKIRVGGVGWELDRATGPCP